MKKQKLYISGMHCKSCEVLLESELKKLKNIAKCKVSHKKGLAELDCSGTVSSTKLAKVVKDCGYQVADNAKEAKAQREKNTQIDYLQIASAFFILVALFLWLGQFEIITRFMPSVSGDVKPAIALLSGFAASLSTCLALVGGIVIGFGALTKTNSKKGNTLMHKARPHLFFHLGRIGGFAALGGILGIIGYFIGAQSASNFSNSWLISFLTILVAFLMLYMGLQVLNLVPNITKFGFHLPKGISQKIEKLKTSDSKLAPIIIGVLTFFLPCGFTLSMQVVAINAGSNAALNSSSIMSGFWQGGIVMALFAIGTLPVLISLGIGSSSMAKKAEYGFAKKFVGVLIVLLAFFNFNNGLSLAGSKFTFNNLFSNPANAQVAEEVQSADSAETVQVVKMDVDYTFKPNEFRIKQGVPVRWEINGVNITGCSDEVIIPSLNITSGKLNDGLNVVEFTPTESGVLPFSCWMGMIHGRFIVEENPELSVTTNDLKPAAPEALTPSSQDSDSAITNTDLDNLPPLKSGSCGGSCGSPSCGAQAAPDNLAQNTPKSCGCGAR
jgi:sulfite exporter TauE/SafE/copper chaperone CopZ